MRNRLASLGVFEKMQHTSNAFIEQVISVSKGVISDSNEEQGLLIFGSPQRLEMLPQSDVDVIVIDQDSARRGQLISALGKLDYDKLDINDRDRLSDLDQCADIGSTESSYCEARFIATNPYTQNRFDTMGITERILKPEVLATKLIYHLFFRDYWYEQKRNTALGTNLKYEKGAYRDLLYFNWVYQYLVGMHNYNSPHIQQSIAELFSNGKRENLRHAVEFISYIKYRTLEINLGTDQKGKGYMNQDTANRLLQSDNNSFSTLGLSNSSQIINYFDKQRHIIDAHKRALFSQVRNKIGNEIDPVVSKVLSSKCISSESYVALYQQGGEQSKVAIIRKLILDKNYETLRVIEGLSYTETNWVILASLLCNEQASNEFMGHVLQNQATMQGYEYLYRLIIRNKATNIDLLLLLKNKEKIVQAEDKNKEYHNLLDSILRAKGLTP